MEARNNSSPLARTGEPKLASRHRQRCHPVLVDKRAAPVGTAIREDLHVGEVGQGAAGERLILREEPPLDLDEKVRPPLHARAEPADEFLSFKLIRYLSCPASHHHRAAWGKADQISISAPCGRPANAARQGARVPALNACSSRCAVNSSGE